MSDDAPHPSRTGWWITVIAATLLLYLLGFGPVVVLISRDSLSVPVRQAAAMLYAPELWVFEHTPLQEPMRAYVVWWSKVLA